MSTIVAILLTFFGLFFASFSLWRKMRDDYPAEQIFSYTTFTFLAVLMSIWLAQGDAARSFWFPFLASVALSIYFARRFSFRTFDLVDAAAPAWFYLSLFLFSASALAGSSLEKNLFWAWAGVAAIALVLYKILSPRYRAFSWYPSGRVGFLGSASLAFYFTVKFLVEIVLSNMVSSLGTAGNLAVAALFGLATWLRSGRPEAETFSQKLKAGFK